MVLLRRRALPARRRRACSSIGGRHSRGELARTLRALAHPDRARLRRRPLLLAARLPGPGDGLPDLRPARPRLGHLRHRARDHRLRRRSPRPASGTSRSPRSSSGTSRASRSPTTARSPSTVESADATRSQYWMLAVMVAFTSLGLWLLSARRNNHDHSPSHTPATGSPALLYLAPVVIARRRPVRPGPRRRRRGPRRDGRRPTRAARRGLRRRRARLGLGLSAADVVRQALGGQLLYGEADALAAVAVEAARRRVCSNAVPCGRTP